MDNPFNDIKELYQQEQHRQKQEEEKIKRDHEKQRAEENKKIAEKTSQRFSQFRQTVNDLSPMIDKVLYQFGDQVWGFTTKRDYKNEKRWYGFREVPYTYEVKNYVMSGLIKQYSADELRNYGARILMKKYRAWEGPEIADGLIYNEGTDKRKDIERPHIAIDVDGNKDRYSTEIHQLYSHYLHSYIFKHNEAYLVGFCKQFHEDIDIVKCTELVVASAISKQYFIEEQVSTGGIESGIYTEHYWKVEFKIQKEKLISADESSLIDALKELFKLRHQL